ncbi:MAG: ABC transporter ATP-binding protein [Euryarchaeota archaeon]|nr:ABC transporter ATP-binding protein [Euryarchaeota archaeon]
MADSEPRNVHEENEVPDDVAGLDDTTTTSEGTSDTTTTEFPDEAEETVLGAAGRDDAIVSLRRVSRWYGEVNAVNDVTVDIGPGITGLLGPNGAGKSTLMRMIVGLQRPSQGAVQVHGREPWGDPKVLRRIGYLPEAPAPWRDHSGHDALMRAARLAGLPKEDREPAVQKALERVGLSDAAEQTVGTYSMGMQQRLKFALALLHEPDLYVLDEPLLGTDPLARRDLMHLMQEMAAEGKSILLSTHVLPDVEALTERVLIMDHGRVLAHGRAADIRDLLERYPRTVRIQTPDPRAVGAALWDWDTVLSVAVDGDTLVVRTDKPADFYERLQTHLIAERLPFSSVSSPDENVEAVFRYLVG